MPGVRAYVTSPLFIGVSIPVSVCSRAGNNRECGLAPQTAGTRHVGLLSTTCAAKLLLLAGLCLAPRVQPSYFYLQAKTMSAAHGVYMLTL